MVIQTAMRSANTHIYIVLNGMIRNMMRNVRLQAFACSLFMILCSALQLNAQLTFKAEAPRQVALNERFQVQFTVSSTNISNFNPPEFDGLNVLFPPQSAVATTIINGRGTTTFTGTFMPQKTGSVTIGPATIQVGNKTLRTQPIQIKVLPADKNINGGSQSPGLADDDVFITVTATPTNVYTQQGLLLTYKLYTRTTRMSFEDVQFPKYDGFIEQELDPQEGAIQVQAEHYKGKNYYTGVIRQSIIFPQRSGTITIPQGLFTVSVAVDTEINSLDDFFSISSIPMVKKTLKSPKLVINVNPLPQPTPPTFSNAVGKFAITASVDDENNLKTGQMGLLKVKVSGSGNIKFVATPSVRFPESFDTFDTQSESNVKATPQGVSGDKLFTYRFMPRNTGAYTIPPISFVFFNPQTKKYETASTNAITLNIKKGEAGSVSGSNGFASDNIAPMMQGRSWHTGAMLQFLSSPWGFVPFVCLLLVAVVVAFIIVKRNKQRNDVVGTRRKQAAKHTQKLFASLQQQLTSQQNGDAFYAALLQILYKYLADKFALPQHSASKNDIRQTLSHEGVDNDTIDKLLTIIDNAEKASFAPDTLKPNKQAMYNDAMELVDSLEKQSKRK